MQDRKNFAFASRNQNHSVRPAADADHRQAALTVGELARKLGAALEGDADRELTGAAALDAAGPRDLTFAGAPKLFEKARSSAACIIAPQEYTGSPGQTVLRATEPRVLFAQALRWLYPEAPFRPGVHASAVVLSAVAADQLEIGAHAVIGENCVIGRGSRIGAGVSIGNSVHLGSGCRIYPRVTIYEGTRIGDRVTLHAGAVIGADGFGFALHAGHYEKFPQVGTVEIGDDVEIGANSCIDRAALGVTSIGSGTKIDNQVHIGHNCSIGQHVVIAAQTGLSGGVTVGDFAVIGGQVGIGDKARIESHAVLGSGSGVLTSKIVRAGQVMWGTPARPLREYLRQLAHASKAHEELEALRREIAALKKG